MSENHTIFDAHLHDEAYAAAYLEQRVTVDQLVSIAGREVESLAGAWTYHPDVYEAGLRAGWHVAAASGETDTTTVDGTSGGTPDKHGPVRPWDFDFDDWPTMHIPATWNVEDERLFYYESTVMFTRTFRYVPRGEATVLIRFGAVAYRAIVFLNGTCLGTHDGGSTPFCVDAGASIREQNRIVVYVENQRRRDRVPMGHTDWFNYGGVHRDVHLVRLPERYIKRAVVELVPDGTFRTVRVTVTLDGTGEGGQSLVEIAELGVRESVPIRDGVGTITVDAQPELWSPEHPRLYDVVITHGVDRIVERVGFREIRVEGTSILLNGRPVFLRGVSQHEESVSHGRSLTEDEVRENLLIAKEMNCNFMRLAHYPHSESVARLADELGIMLWEEVPVYWAIDFSNPTTLNDAQNQLRELIVRDQNRASVIIWSVGNENPDTDERLTFMRSLVDTAMSEDGTRPVTAACLFQRTPLRVADRLAEHLDIIGINEYFGWYEPDVESLSALFADSRPNKPVIVSEFGAAAPAGQHGTAADLFTEEHQAQVYRRQTAVLGAIPYVVGTCPWVLYDFRSPKRLNRYQRGYNRKGLLDAEKRRRKRAFLVMQEFYGEIAAR